MKTLIALITVGSIFLPSANAVDLEKLASQPATIEAVAMNPSALEISEEKKGWNGIPERFKFHNATIFKPERDQLGVAEFRVVKDGYVLLACNFDYQGNRSGGWSEEALSKDEFQKLGWKQIRNPKIAGGSLVQNDGRIQTIFYKKVHKGEYCRLRCNKYDPPYPILLRRTAHEGAQQTDLKADKIELTGSTKTKDQILQEISGAWRFKTTGNNFFIFPNGIAADHLGNLGTAQVTDLARGVVRIKVKGTYYYRVTEQGELSGAGISGGSKHPAIRVDR